MSGKKAPPAPADAFKQLVDTITNVNREWQATEAARIARLTPEQLAAEKAAQIDRRIAEQADTFRKMGPAVLARESWSIPDFAWLLTGGNPNDTGWGFFGRDDALPEPTKYREVLQSCVSVSLHPVDRDAPRDQWRFRTEDLLAVATNKGLGQHAALRRALPVTTKDRKGPQTAPVPHRSSPITSGAADRSASVPNAGVTAAIAAYSSADDRSQPLNAAGAGDAPALAGPAPALVAGDSPHIAGVPAPALAGDLPLIAGTPNGRTSGPNAADVALADSLNPTDRGTALARAGTAGRERRARLRRKYVLELAREFVKQGRGVEHQDQIDLAIKAPEFVAAFHERHAEFRNVAKKTLDEDRAFCRPKVHLEPGRPQTATKT